MKQDIPEIWRPIEGFEGFYEISTSGRVKSLKRTILRAKVGSVTFAEKILKQANSHGYRLVQLQKKGFSRRRRVHQLMIETFWDLIPNCPNPKLATGLEPNHADGIRSNNVLSNLEFVTKSYNIKHSYQVLNRVRKCCPNGERYPTSKLTDADMGELYDHLKAGKSVYSFAKKKGVAKQTVHDIVIGKSWKHLKIDFSKVYTPKYHR